MLKWSMLLGCLLALQVHATVYEWVDASGRKHFSDKRPKDDQSYTEKSQKVQQPEVDHAARRRKEDLANFYRQSEKTDRKEAETAQKSKAKREEKQARCKAAKRLVQRDQSVSHFYRLDDNGNREIWSHEERLAYRRKLNRAVERFCR